MPSTGARNIAQGSARELLRTTILDAMRDLLVQRDWSKITLTEVAAGAGVSRQTLYNEFGSRGGLAEAYAVRLADHLVDHVETALAANVGDAQASIRDGLASYFHDSAQDPLVQSLLLGEVKLDLLRLITLDAGTLIAHATERLSTVMQRSWIALTQAQARTFAHALVRLAISYIPTPPPPGHDAPAELGRVFSPYVAAVLAERGLR
ncbi:TetR family transcriptional regulator [Nocardia rhamnosiphila]